MNELADLAGRMETKMGTLLNNLYSRRLTEDISEGTLKELITEWEKTLSTAGNFIVAGNVITIFSDFDYVPFFRISQKTCGKCLYLDVFNHKIHLQ